MTSPSRRRFIAISAAAAGLPLIPPGRGSAQPVHARTWRGTALGADATLVIHHSDPVESDRLVRVALAEVSRLEKIFSLYDPGSALSRFNRQGYLDEPPSDLVSLLAASVHFGQMTGGAFDVTVQPIWQLYAKHFTAPDADPGGPPREAIEDALTLVDYRKIVVDAGRIALGRPGMAVTLNGIAQGYITDRVVARLRREGITSSLVDMGEIRAIGSHPDTRPWTVGLQSPVDSGRTTANIELVDRAVATSGGYGLRFDARGRFNHLLDPRLGGSATDCLSVSVIASDATAADALSTALAIRPSLRADPKLRAIAAALFVWPDGSVTSDFG